MAPGVRKLSLRNIAPRSYSSLLKSESEEEEGEEQEEKADKSTVKPNVVAASNQGNWSFVFADYGLKISDDNFRALLQRESASQIIQS